MRPTGLLARPNLPKHWIRDPWAPKTIAREGMLPAGFEPALRLEGAESLTGTSYGSPRPMNRAIP